MTTAGVPSPAMAELMRRLAAEDGPQPDPTLLPAAEGRALAEATNRRWNRPLPEMERAGDVLVPPDASLGTAAVPLRVLVPPGAAPGAVLFVHGGGFAFCSPLTHERCARVLALETGRPVLLPAYRLAPEHPFPAGLHDVVASLRGALPAAAALGVAPGPLVLAGDSAGANLALAAMLHEGRDGRQLAAGALLFYGVYGADFTTRSYREHAEGPGLTTAKMRRYWDWYCPEAARRDLLAAPLLAGDEALRALPSLHLMAAGVDPLLSDTLLLGERLRALGRGETVQVVPGVVHGFLQMSAELPVAAAALRDAAAAAARMG